MTADRKWANAVRVLTLVCVVLAALVVVQARTIRIARAEVQLVRSEHERVRADVIAAWTREPAAEIAEIIRGLDAFYADTSTGFGRAGGLCAAGHLDEQPIVAYVLDVYARARAEGRSAPVAHEAMDNAILQSDEYRRVRPELALTKAAN